MKYTEEEVEIIAKSMYKAVKKALGSSISDDSKKKARLKTGKEVVEDVLDPNYIAEAKEKVPPRKQAQMNKSCKKSGKSGLIRLKDLRERAKNKRK